MSSQYLSRLNRGYFRNGPPHRGGADVSFADIVKVFGFQRVRIGRWVNSAETQLAANLFFDALADLQQMLVVPATVISLRGTLQLSFGIGGEPGCCAFYEPGRRNLALAKNAGGGSLAHEWFHAFDHYISQHLFLNCPATAFASERFLTNAPLNSHPLNQPLAIGYQQLLLSADGKAPSGLLQRAIALDAQRQCFYFAKPQEVCARGFESMLAQLPQKNAFLVSLSSSRDGSPSPYLLPIELAAVQQPWLSYFALLGQQLAASPKSQ